MTNVRCVFPIVRRRRRFPVLRRTRKTTRVVLITVLYIFLNVVVVVVSAFGCSVECYSLENANFKLSLAFRVRYLSLLTSEVQRNT